MGSPERILRFIAEDGLEHYGSCPASKESFTNDISEVSELVLSGERLVTSELKSTGKMLKVKQLLTPIPAEHVPDVWAVGLNYTKHWEEGAKKRGEPLPKVPGIFMKPSSSLTGSGSNVMMPAGLNLVDPGIDYEAELCIVIGKKCRNVSAEDAMDYVFGFTASNDVSARHWQRNCAGQWVRGKSFDTFTPVGPAILTPKGLDSLGKARDASDLKIQTQLNGKTEQASSTSDLIFGITKVVEWLSIDTTLLPGTLILTGTPEGVGYAKGLWMKPGDSVEVWIEGIGTLQNPIVAAEPPAKRSRLGDV